MLFDPLAWRSLAARLGQRPAMWWTVGQAMVRIRLREVRVQDVLARGRRVAPVSPVPEPLVSNGARPFAPPPAPYRPAPSSSDRSSALDAPTTLLATLPPPEQDLWDDDLHLAQRRFDPVPATPLARWAYLLVPVALAGLAGAVGLGRPALWTDELATWGMATTPWSQFWPVLRWVDAVLAPYYVLMHLWVDVFGDSDVSLRVPSLLAMAGAAALVAAIGHQLSSRTGGMIAGTVFALLASTSRFAAEARPYAFTVFMACLATWLLMRATRRSHRWRWIAYGIAVALLGWLQVVALLLVAAHAWTVLAWRRDLWWRFVAAASAGTLASAVVLVYGYRQRSQVSYIQSVGMDTMNSYAQVLFGGTAVAVVLAILVMFSLPLRMPSAAFTAWAVVPTLALVAVSAVLPMFLPRYLLFTVPGWALAAGMALTRARPGWSVVVIALLACLALPAQWQIRATDGHGQDTRGAALLVGTGVEAGDGIVYADNEAVGGWTGRDAIAHYLPADYRPQDVLAVTTQRTDGLLLASECLDVSACLGVRDRLWVVRAQTLDDPLTGIGPSKEDLLRDGYDLVQSWHPAGMTVALLQRKSAS